MLLVYLCTLVAVSLWGLSYIWCDRLINLTIPVEFFLPVRILLAGLILLCVNLALGFNIRIVRTAELLAVLRAELIRTVAAPESLICDFRKTLRIHHDRQLPDQPDENRH